jgi:hypothetical protein
VYDLTLFIYRTKQKRPVYEYHAASAHGQNFVAPAGRSSHQYTIADLQAANAAYVAQRSNNAHFHPSWASVSQHGSSTVPTNTIRHNNAGVAQNFPVNARIVQGARQPNMSPSIDVTHPHASHLHAAHPHVTHPHASASTSDPRVAAPRYMNPFPTTSVPTASSQSTSFHPPAATIALTHSEKPPEPIQISESQRIAAIANYNSSSLSNALSATAVSSGASKQQTPSHVPTSKAPHMHPNTQPANASVQFATASTSHPPQGHFVVQSKSGVLGASQSMRPPTEGQPPQTNVSQQSARYRSVFLTFTIARTRRPASSASRTSQPDEGSWPFLRNRIRIPAETSACAKPSSCAAITGSTEG